MADFVSHENRIRLFLAFLILVLVVVNSQSLIFSHTSRALLIDSFNERARVGAQLVATDLDNVLSEEGGISSFLETVPREHSVESACLMDWNGRVLGGSAGCDFSQTLAFDRLDRSGLRSLVEEGWAITPVSPPSEPESAVAFGYLALRNPDGSDRGVLRIEAPASSLAEANRSFRSTLIYQVSAMALVLLTLILFLNSLVAPHRRLVAEARSVAGDVGTSGSQDEGQFLLATFQDVVAKLRDKETQLAEMHRLEKARADETQALATDIIRTMNTGLVSLDERGCVALVNPAAEGIFGVEAHELEKRSFADAFPGSTELSEWVTNALSRGEGALRRRVEYQRTSGDSIHLGASVLPLGPTGNVRGALCLVADLTEVIDLREKLSLKENLARLGEMAGGIAHEFRNSLATIVGNAKLLKETVSSESANPVVDALVDECTSLSHVVTEFLQFARPEDLRASPFDLAEMAEDLCRDLDTKARAAGVRLVVDASSFEVEADEMLLRKAVSNLILNAIEAAGGAGEEDGEVRVGTGGQNGLGFVRVADNGPGVREKDLQRIFTPFFTTKSEGTGLGLSIVQKIAVSHNGEVQVSSEPGGGTTFVLHVPAQLERFPAREGEWV